MLYKILFENVVQSCRVFLAATPLCSPCMYGSVPVRVRDRGWNRSPFLGQVFRLEIAAIHLGRTNVVEVCRDTTGLDAVSGCCSHGL